MAGFTLTTWNVEWLEFSAGVDLGWLQPGQKLFPKKAPTKKAARDQIAALKSVIAEIDPDILFLCEAVKGPTNMGVFTAKHLPEYNLVVRPSGGSNAYGIGGIQWLWFLVKKGFCDTCSPRLLDLQTWRAFTAEQSKSGRTDGKWMVSIPQVKGSKLLPSMRRAHGHYRSPQVLVLDWQGSRLEVIGLHLKSKLVTKAPRKRKVGESFESYAKLKPVAAYLSKSHSARVKLSTEATDVRHFIDRRFAQDADPLIFVVGDLNDGPGKELLEREYLFHDLIGNLQGEIFFADRFLNHALFDQPNDLRWTARHDDFLDPDRPPQILLDHILFTQALAGGGSGPLRVPPQGGRVEHEIFERVQSQHSASAMSDHRPVTVRVNPR